MATQTVTPTESERARAGKEKIRQLRELFADAPELGRKALDNVLHELTAQATQPPPEALESAGRTGVRLGKVSELTIVVPFAPGGAKRLRAFLRLIGGNLSDSLNGSGAATRLVGGGGNDRLIDTSGNDTLQGGMGVDTLTGGSGGDQFVFTEAGAANADLVTNFELGLDKVVLDRSAFGSLGAADFVAGDARFRSGAGLTSGQDADDRVIYNTTTGQLFFDADGSGPNGSQLIVMLNNRPALTASDITLVGQAAPSSGGTIRGTAGNDSIDGTAGNDSIEALAGSDTINALAGDDTLRGGDGNDRLDGGTGTNVLDGGTGDDFFSVLEGAATFLDAGGNDTISIATRDFTLPAGFENGRIVSEDTPNARLVVTRRFA